jgi:ribosomal protein S3
MIKKKYEAAQVSSILSEFSKTKALLNIHCRRPGVIVGSGGGLIGVFFDDHSLNMSIQSRTIGLISSKSSMLIWL